VARVLGKVGFGELAIINSTTMMFELFACFGLGSLRRNTWPSIDTPTLEDRTHHWHGLVDHRHHGKPLRRVTCRTCPWLARILGRAAPGGLLRITGIALFITALNAAQSGARWFEAFKTIASRNIIAGLLSFPIMITGVFVAGLRGASGQPWFPAR
jgi:hypothetical protein